VSALEPGRLYMAKVEGAPERLLLVEWGGWASDASGNVWNPDCITDARPLIVIDLGNDLRREYVLEILRAARHGWTHDVADQIEAQTKPARIPEPGLWGVVYTRLVNASTWESWLRHPVDGWHPIKGGVATRWDDLIDPILIREGVES